MWLHSRAIVRIYIYIYIYIYSTILWLQSTMGTPCRHQHTHLVHTFRRCRESRASCARANWCFVEVWIARTVCNGRGSCSEGDSRQLVDCRVSLWWLDWGMGGYYFRLLHQVIKDGTLVFRSVIKKIDCCIRISSNAFVSQTTHLYLKQRIRISNNAFVSQTTQYIQNNATIWIFRI